MPKYEKAPTDILTDPAFDEAYLALCRYARTRCRTSDEADEVVSDTVLSLVQAVRAGQEIENLAGYLRVIFARRHSDYLRRKYRDRCVTPDDGTLLAKLPDDYDPDALPEALREAEAVRRAIARLSALYREVVYRHYMRGESVEHIARALEVPVGTVKSRLFDGRSHMRGTVEAHLAEGSVPPKSTKAVAGKAMNEQKRSTRTSDLPTQDTRPYAELAPTRPKPSASVFGGMTAVAESRFAICGRSSRKTFSFWPTRSPFPFGSCRRLWTPPRRSWSTR